MLCDKVVYVWVCVKLLYVKLCVWSYGMWEMGCDKVVYVWSEAVRRREEEEEEGEEEEEEEKEPGIQNQKQEPTQSCGEKSNHTCAFGVQIHRMEGCLR